MPINSEWRPDKSSDVPLYMQIVDRFRDLVITGEWSPGYRIPSQRDLAVHFKVNRSTISTAIDELISHGILKTEVGRGTFVEDELWNSLVEPPKGWNIYRDNGLFIENTESIQMVNELLGNNDYINLGSNDLPKESTHISYIKKSLMDLSDELENLNYLPPLGHYGLREQIAKQLIQKGIYTSPENIFVTSGSVQALHLISLAMVKKEMTLFTEDPSYINTLNIFQSMGIDIKKIGMDRQGISMTRLSKAIKKTDFSLLYTIPNYHNPTNILMSKKRRDDLLQWCEHNKIAIIEDDAYGDLWFDEMPPHALKSSDNNGLVLYLGTVSQTLSAGLRLGWIVGPKPVIKRLSDVKMQTDYGTSSLSQLIVKRLFESGAYDVHLNSLRRRLKEKRNIMLDLLKTHFKNLGTWSVPKGGYNIWLNLNTKVPAAKLFNTAFERKIILDPNMSYEDKDLNGIRLSYSSIHESSMEPALKILKDIIIKIQK